MNKQISRISRQQVEDWLESPVTEMLREFAVNERDEVAENRGLNAYVANEPQRTQENMIYADAAFAAWNEIVEILEEGEHLFEEEEEEDEGY